MDMNEIRGRARALGLAKTSRMRKADVIRWIQRTEGNVDCYASPGRFDCLQNDCLWRPSCRTARVR